MASADRDALEALFRSTGGDSWEEKFNWATDAELSTWYGVNVDEDNRVVELALGSFVSGNNLKGPIPEVLRSLTNLMVLGLSNNRLTGPIPEVLGSLTDLTKLDLSKNQLTGPIPEVLGSLTNLTKLDLSGNQLTGPIPEVLGSLTNLTELRLLSNKLRGPIPEVLGSLTNLTELRFLSNKLTGPIPEALGSLTNLTGLDLSGNQLRGPIPEAQGSLINLTGLDLSSNELTGPIPEVLGSLTNLTRLNLSHNKLTGPIPEALGSLTNLTGLNLWNNQLRGPIPEVLRSLTNLAGLNLSDNKLSGPIPEVHGSLTNLTELYLSGNQLTGPIPETLGSLTNLMGLDLSYHQLTGPIPEALGSLINLTGLDLSHNKLTGPIPEALGSLTNLTGLRLAVNQLTGPIPEVLGSLTNLTKLYLSGNQLTGTVPLGVWKLPSLQRLRLADNLLTHFTVPEGETAATDVVLDCMERLERHRAARSFKGLYAAGNPWEFPPAAVVANGLESIRKYYHTWEQCDFRLVEVLALKVVFVGAYGAGKTSLARSIKMGRGDRTPDVDDNSRTTVGVDLHNHNLSNGTECKIYDVAGQVTYYGLHQFFLTERAVYVIVWDATEFEGLRGNDLDKAIEKNILEWVSLLHMRTPLCTVMLVGSHYDLLDGTPEDNEQLLVTVEKRFLELHEEWKSLRDDQSSSMDGRMTILPGVFRVGCKLASESASFTAEDGLRAVDEALSRQTSVASRVPPSWVTARQVLEHVGKDCLSGDSSGVDGGRRRPWELRSVLHAKFNDFVEEGRRNASQGAGHHHPASCLSGLRGDGIRYSMDGAIEMRAFSGTVISHDVFVVLDVRWLAGVLKPILDHRGVTKNKKGRPVFANRELTGSNLLTWARELVGRGILREGFARFLWSLKTLSTESVDDSHEMEPAMLEEILDEMGVTIPLPEASLTTPDDESSESSTAVAAVTKSPGDGGDAPRRHVVDLLVIMRLPLEADAETRDHLSSARQAALTRGDTIDGGNRSLKAVFEFDRAGAPHGLPERVMALSHRIGAFSPRARWRLGGLILLHNTCSSRVSSMILEYDKKNKTFSVEALGQTTPEIRAVQFVISAFFHVARDFPGASWTGWMECAMGHDGEKMYHLATPNEKENHTPGMEIVPLIRSSRSDRGSKQQNVCEMRGFDRRGDCTLDPDIFGRVLDVRQPFMISDEAPSKAGSKDRNTTLNSSTTSQRLAEIAGDVTKLTETVGRVEGGVTRVETGVGRVEGGVGRVEARVDRVEGGVTRVEESMERVEGSMERVEGGVTRVETGVCRVEGGMGRVEAGVDRVEGSVDRVEEGVSRIAGGMDRVEERVERVEGGMDRVEEGVGRVEGGIEKIDGDIQRIVRGMQESLMRLKNLQRPNYPYPHLVAVKNVKAEGKRSLWSRLRGMFVMDMTLHFLCSFNRSEVPCGVGGTGYRLRKTRGWVKKISPALQVTAVTAKVALRAVAGVDISGFPEGFLQDFKTGLAEELVDRTLDEDALLRVLSGEEDAGPSMQRETRASYEAITKFMRKEEAERSKTARDGDGYVDFRDSMEQVHDEKRELVWVRKENVQKWKDALPATVPST
eukprot:g9959.t1